VRKIVHTDLTKLEGEPTARADILHERISHSTEVRWLGGRVTSTTTGPAGAPTSISTAVLQLSLAGGVGAGVIGGVLGIASDAPAWLIATFAVIAFFVPIETGTRLMFRSSSKRQDSSSTYLDPDKAERGAQNADPMREKPKRGEQRKKH